MFLTIFVSFAILGWSLKLPKHITQAECDDYGATVKPYIFGKREPATLNPIYKMWKVGQHRTEILERMDFDW